MPREVRRIETLLPRRSGLYGGKARGLAALCRAGFPVPAAYAVPATSFAAFVQTALPVDDQLPALLSRDLDPVRLDAIRARLQAAPFPAELERAIRDAFAALVREGASGIAVRSSSTQEDQRQASAAGLHTTVLNVRDADAVLDAVRTCWASAFTPPVLTYLRRLRPDADRLRVNDGTWSTPSVGVVLQAMVPADIAGVLFTVNPLTGDAGEVVINAAFGLGSSVVDGTVSPDTLRIDKATRAPRDRVLGSKECRMVVDRDGGLRREAVSESERSHLALNEDQTAALVEMALRVEQVLHGPHDVEWAFTGETLYVLQARPVTTALQPGTRRWKQKRSDPLERSRIVWSNVNVGEALPGVATPLTWSILSGFSDLGFRRAFGSLGCTVPKEAELVGCFRGRIYLNMSEFMGILSQIPGLTPRTILALGGGGEVERLESDVERRSPLKFLARLPVTASRFARENYQMSARLETFEATFAAERRRLSVDPQVLSSTALDRMLTDVEHLLDESGAIMLTAYGNLLSSAVVLVGALRLFARDRADTLQRDLLTGLADLDSAVPGIRLWYIAEMARAEPAASDALLHGAVRRVEDLPDGPTRRALETFLHTHGHRGAGEAEVAVPRWREDPSLPLTTLRLHLQSTSTVTPLELERRQLAVREAAEAEVARRVPRPGRTALRHVLAMVQRFTRLRERLRGYVTEVLGMFRVVALDASRRIALSEPEAGDDAGFYLSLDELHGLLRHGGSVATRVRQRRTQTDRDRRLPDPPDTFVGYPPPAESAMPPSDDPDLLRGLAASGGRVRGLVRLIERPNDVSDVQPGEVLVSSCADVGWAPLFLTAAAVVTDLGGPLSHASIVLREYGVPAVVNVKYGTRILRTGDEVVVDGDRGEVRLVKRATAVAGEARPGCDPR